MMFSTRSEYGVRVMIQLARRRGAGPGAAGRHRRGRGAAAGLPRAAGVAAAQGGPRVAPRAARTAAMSCRATRPRSRWPRSCRRSRGHLIPMQCFDELGGTRVLCNHVDDGFENCATKLLWTRVQGGVDAGARADDARRAGAVRRARRRRRRSAAAARRSGATHAPAAPATPTDYSTNRKAIRMADLEIQNLHVNVEGKEILKGVDLAVSPRRGPRADGPERLRQVDAREHDHGPPELRDHRGQDPLPGRGRDRVRARRARPRRASSWRSSTRPRSPACRS